MDTAPRFSDNDKSQRMQLADSGLYEWKVIVYYDTSCKSCEVGETFYVWATDGATATRFLRNGARVASDVTRIDIVLARGPQ